MSGGGGYGGSGYGGDGYGGGGDFNLLSATAVDYRTVDLVFSDPLFVSALLSSPGSYSFTGGLSCLAAVQTSDTSVRLFTTNQAQSYVYKVTVSLLILSADERTLTINYALFDGIGVVTQFLVSGLDARSVCSGQAIYLLWTNPGGVEHVKIVRRLRAWPFDLTDDFDTVYDGAPIDSFFDTGVASPQTTLTVAANVGDTQATVSSVTGLSPNDQIRIESLTGTLLFDLVTVSSIVGSVVHFTPALVNAHPIGDRLSESTVLLPLTYYYYLVLVSMSPTPTDADYDIGDASQIMGLSIPVYTGQAWLNSQTPQKVLALDLAPTTQGGGGGFLAKWFAVMGCWLNLMRGTFNALALLGDPNNAPFSSLTARNQSLGIDPEGLSFDYDIVRRPLTSLVYVYKRKGTCPGIIETVRMFTKWDALCTEFGGAGCNNGASDLKTWDGVSIISAGSGPYGSQITETIDDVAGDAELDDSSQTWTPHLFQNGTFRGAIGDVACVNDNPTSTQATTFAPTPVTTLASGASPGDTSLAVESSVTLQPGMTIQLFSTLLEGEIVQISAIPSPGTLTLATPVKNTYASGSQVTIGKSILRPEYLGTTAATATLQVITDTAAKFCEFQWVGYKLLDSTNVKHNITANTGTTITVDGAAPASGQYAIAADFNLGGSFSARVPIAEYIIRNGVHSTLWEPTLDLAERGTLYDPSNVLWYGPGLNLVGDWGPSDIGIYILGNVPITVGRASTVTGAVFTLDPTEAAPSTNEWVGNFLNPNQNQEQLIEILANDSTTVTVAGDITSLVVAGQAYYILAPRDKTRYTRIVARLKNEFVDSEVTPHVLFM